MERFDPPPYVGKPRPTAPTFGRLWSVGGSKASKSDPDLNKKVANIYIEN